MNRGLVASARKKLLRRGRALLRGAAHRVSPRDPVSGSGSDRPGGAHGRPDALGGMAEADVAELREIHAALERIERGIFGRCDGCQALVEEERLELVPWERHCAPCRGEEARGIEAASERALA